jgi:hypothetical protein
MVSIFFFVRIVTMFLKRDLGIYVEAIKLSDLLTIRDLTETCVKKNLMRLSSMNTNVNAMLFLTDIS